MENRASAAAALRRIATSAPLEEAQLAEGLLSETWAPGFSQAGERRPAVMERGRQRAHC